jgi:hypothetical protein
MAQIVKINFFNDRLNIAMVNIKQVYLLFPQITALLPEVYRGN